MIPRAARTIAWRDLRSLRTHFAVAIAALASGVAAMSAARGVGDAFSARIRGDMRQWLAADAVVVLLQPPTEEQSGSLAQLAREGVEQTVSMETLTMASSTQAADPLLVSVRALDPRRYPFYGAVSLEPAMPLPSALQADSVVISRPAAGRLGVAPGGSVRLNGARFRVAAILSGEPDRLAAARNAHPRVILSEEAFARSAIARSGNAILWRLMFRAAAPDAGALETRLQQIFPDGQVLSYRANGDPRVEATLDAALSFLDLTAWMALVLGAAGVTVVFHLHIGQRLDTVAVMKALGGRSSLILAIYLLEVGCLGLAGAMLGAALGFPLERGILRLLGRQLPFPVEAAWQWKAAAEAVAMGLGSALLAAAVPLARVRATPPLLVLRRDVEGRPTASAAVACVLGLAALAFWMMHSWSIGASFLFGAAAGIAILIGAGRGLMRVVAWTARRWRARLPVSLRHGVLALHRPGSHSAVCFAGLAAGVMMVSASWVGPRAVVEAIAQSLPMRGSGLYVLGLGGEQARSLARFLDGHPDVPRPVELLPVTVLRLAKVRHVPPGRLPRRIPERWLATCSETAPPAENQVLLAESIAASLGVSPGDALEFAANGKTIAVRVAGLRSLDAIEVRRSGMVLPCAAFAGLSVSYEAGIAVIPGREDAVLRAIAARDPSAAAISRGELLAAFQSVGGDAMLVLRLISLLILASGAVIMMFLVAAEGKTRIREIALRKALGARPRQVRAALLSEFGFLGAAAGAAGGVVGGGFASLLLSVVFRKMVWAWNWRALVCAVALSAVAAMASGWMAVAPMVRLKPLAILRAE